MRILIDIGHPAHVHYFRNFIKIMQLKGHEFLISSRDKEVSHILLEKYGIPYFNRGKGSKSLPGKLVYLIKADFLLLKESLKFIVLQNIYIFLPHSSISSQLLSTRCYFFF